MKEGLKIVLTVFTDESIEPVIVLGKSMGPRSFSGHLDTVRDLDLFYDAPSNIWNTKGIWRKFLRDSRAWNGYRAKFKASSEKMQCSLS